MRMYIAILLFVLGMSVPAASASECTEADKKKIQVELNGIEALRKVGFAGISLNSLRGACTVVRSVEGTFMSLAEPVIRKALEVLKDQGGIDLTDADLHVISSICENLHHYTDEFAVGRRERELKERLAQCN